MQPDCCCSTSGRFHHREFVWNVFDHRIRQQSLKPVLARAAPIGAPARWRNASKESRHRCTTFPVSKLRALLGQTHREEEIETPLARARLQQTEPTVEKLWRQKLGAALAAALLSLAPMAVNMTLSCPWTEAQARARLSSEEQHDIDVFKKAKPAVVFITTYAARRDTFTPNILEMPQGAGSGFVWDNNGHLITSLHVVKGANEVRVTFSGGQDVKAKMIGIDEDKDLAVLSVDASQLEDDNTLQPLHLGISSDLLVGQRVYALGNPFGLDHTLTTGIISGTGREITSGFGGRPIQDVVQTDASINPGNSGGPLLDSEGDVIGINTAIYSTSGTSSGIGFAIPIDTVKMSVNQILQFGRVTRPVLGISFAPDQTAEQIGVAGILVLDTKEDGPARLAGIQGTRRDEYGRLIFGDIITAVNGKRTKKASDLYKALDKSKVGDILDLEVLREKDSRKEHVSVTLGSG